MNLPELPQLQTPDQQSYSKFNLEFLGLGIGAIALTLSLLSSIGDGIAKRDVCFIPKTVKQGSCKVNKISTVPEPFIVSNRHKSSNPDYNSYAFLSSENLYTVRRISPDNPHKLNFGIGAVISGLGCMVLAQRLREKLNLLRPHFIATNQLEQHKANTQLRLSSDLLDYSAAELLRHIKHLKSAEAKIHLLRNITPQQVNLLLMAMSEQDYHEFGYLLDGGQSFDKFLPVVSSQSNQNSPQIEPINNESLASNGDLNWVKSFLSTTCLVWGSQGSGKSWLSRYLLREKSKMGYQLVVLDPNSNSFEWQGVRLINTYPEIQEFMEEYVNEVMNRYTEFGKSNISEEEWRSNLWKQGKAISVLCEEVSTYADFIEDKELLSKFFKCALTLSRKQEMPCIFVSHNNTQSCLGGISGLAKVIERSQQLQPLTSVDPITKQPISSGKALLKIENSNQWIEVQLPKLSEKIRDFSNNLESEPVTNNSEDIEKLERLFNAKPELSKEAKLLYDFLVRTEKKLCTASSIQPCYKINGNRFSSEQIKQWLAEIGLAGYGQWDGNVLKLE